MDRGHDADSFITVHSRFLSIIESGFLVYVLTVIMLNNGFLQIKTKLLEEIIFVMPPFAGPG